MKIWDGYGSEHSMNLVMIGRFNEVADAVKAKQLIERLTEQVKVDIEADRIRVGDQADRFTEGVQDLLWKEKFYSLSPVEVEQFAYDVTVEVEGNQVTVKTDEVDVSAFLKILLDNRARIEVYSAHNYPDARNDHG